MFNTTTVLSEIFLSTVIKHARGTRTMVLAEILLELVRVLVEKGNGRRSVGEVGTEAAGLHALKTEGEGTFDLAVLDGIVNLI
jgi:hypothetical protein